jgi:hypothetical protein
LRWEWTIKDNTKALWTNCTKITDPARVESRKMPFEEFIINKLLLIITYYILQVTIFNLEEKAVNA